jgi:hypothetical protein
MLYFVHRFEHVIRSFTKSWLEQQDHDMSMADLTAAFLQQDELLRAMHRSFVDGAEHVSRSLQHYLCHEV